MARPAKLLGYGVEMVRGRFLFRSPNAVCHGDRGGQQVITIFQHANSPRRTNTQPKRIKRDNMQNRNEAKSSSSAGHTLE